MNHATMYRCSILETMMLGVLTLVVLSALLMAARPAQAQTESVAWSESVLWIFGAGGDCTYGCYPDTSLTFDGAGNLYGGVRGGFFLGSGTVFELSPNGSGGWNETNLYNFCSLPNCADGDGGLDLGVSSVIFDSQGNLYGTTGGGGANGDGVVFELSPEPPSGCPQGSNPGNGWCETVLYSFENTGDGVNPSNSGLIFDPAGNLYGTAEDGGGGYGPGVVFELSPSGGGWTEQVIYVDGFLSPAGVTMDAAGNLFGTSNNTVFELSPNGSGGWNPTTIYAFSNSIYLWGTPVLDQAGNLYGTSLYGGAANVGTVYKLSPKKKGKWSEKTLYSFPCLPRETPNGKACTYSDGANPYAGVVLDQAGNLYGTTWNPQTLFPIDSYMSTVYELVAPVGKGAYKHEVLWVFLNEDMQNPDGDSLLGSLIFDGAGNLYGTASGGGTNGNGVVFELTPTP